MEGEGEEAEIVSVEPPGTIHQSICAVGRLFVLAGAIWKGKSEYNEMTSLGLKKYFQTTVNFSSSERFDRKIFLREFL